MKIASMNPGDDGSLCRATALFSSGVGVEEEVK